MLQEIADLKDAARDLRFRAMAAERGLANSFAAYAKQHRLLECAIKEISQTLAEKLGDELYPHAMKLLESARVPALVEFNRMPSEDRFDVILIQGEIPRLCYAMRVLGAKQ